MSTGDNPRDKALEAAREAKERFRPQLLGHPDVHGVGVGKRRRAGEKTDEYAVVVHVHRKFALSEIPQDRRLPTELRFEGRQGDEIVVRVDVQEHPKPTPEIGRVRPVPGGVSAGYSGTLGGWVWDAKTSQVVALSNAHVFGTDTGVAICQPSVEDGGRNDMDSIATVLRLGTLDAAVATPVDPSIVSKSIVNGGPAVFDVMEATVGMHVQKTGRGTGLTFGVVDLIDYDSDYFGSHSDLWIDGGSVDFSAGGDSGSLYLESQGEAAGRRRVIGLHWGGSRNDGVGHRIQSVFADLGLTVLPTGDE
ncbi:hypothetical protein ABZW10_03550 [Kitasatospora sp. NPDC004723]|uniref:hypothetical protein n=1 Tax=Kitasatospora sp. NPDC004723 TaxID=3154288 RepID=UPI0033AF93D2